MGVCVDMLRCGFLQLGMLICDGSTPSSLARAPAPVSSGLCVEGAARVKQFWPWAGNGDFGSRLLCVPTSAYTEMFEGWAAPEAKT